MKLELPITFCIRTAVNGRFTINSFSGIGTKLVFREPCADRVKEAV